MHDENIILPFRRGMPKLLRLHRAVERLASWCSWRCPLGAFVFIVAGNVFPTPAWWRATWYIAVAFFIALLFCSYGLVIAMGAFLVERPHKRFEGVGRLAGVLGGIAFAGIGLVGAWELFRSGIAGL